MRYYSYKNLELRYICDSGRWYVLSGCGVVQIGNSPDFFSAVDELKKLV